MIYWFLAIFGLLRNPNLIFCEEKNNIKYQKFLRKKFRQTFGIFGGKKIGRKKLRQKKTASTFSEISGYSRYLNSFKMTFSENWIFESIMLFRRDFSEFRQIKFRREKIQYRASIVRNFGVCIKSFIFLFITVWIYCIKGRGRGGGLAKKIEFPRPNFKKKDQKETNKIKINLIKDQSHTNKTVLATLENLKISNKS